MKVFASDCVSKQLKLSASIFKNNKDFIFLVTSLFSLCLFEFTDTISIVGGIVQIRLCVRASETKQDEGKIRTGTSIL